MSLRSKILTIMVLPVLVLCAATIALIALRQATTKALDAERYEASLGHALAQVQDDLVDAEAATRGFLLTGDRSFLDPFTEAQAKLPGDIETLVDATRGNAEETKLVADIQDLAGRRMTNLEMTLTLSPVKGTANNARLITLMSEGMSVTDDVRRLVDAENVAGARELADGKRHVDASRQVASFIGIVGMPLCFIASLLVVALFAQRLVTRIRRTESIARMLDEGMPLGSPSTSVDELGQLERVLVRSGTRVVELQGELRRMGTSDALTRLMNRRGFQPTAEHQLTVAKRSHRTMALMFLDLDGLKRVNDTLGHAAGDGMLTEGAFVLRETFRAADLIARMGGDEFCVLFATDSFETAQVTLSRLQTAVDDVNAQDGRQFLLSFSAGVAMFDPEEPLTLDQLIVIADERMYVSKRAKQGAAGNAAAIA